MPSTCSVGTSSTSTGSSRPWPKPIEAITEGFSLYDAEDRLVVCNSHYREMFAYGPDTVTPGMTFERIVSRRSDVSSSTGSDGQAWLAERIERHRNPTGPHVQHRSDGRWIRVSERLTAAGGVVATYTDITELKSREAELDAAHAQVTALNETLRSDNLRMEGELDVTRRLQLMLLPDARGAAADRRPGDRLPHAARARGRRRLLRRPAARRAG